MSQRLRIGKVPVDVLTFAQALDAIEALVEKKDGGFVFTPNVDHVVVADANDAFAAAYQRASLSLADGMPVVWASRLLGTPLPERVTGADIITPLLEALAFFDCAHGPRRWLVLVGMTTTTPAGHLRSRFSSHTARQPTAAPARARATPAALRRDDLGGFPNSRYDALSAGVARKYGVPARLVKSAIMQEFRFNPAAGSGKGARGLMQLMPATAREFGVKNVLDPRQNIEGGTKYPARMLCLFKSDVSLARAASDAGPGNVLEHHGVPPFRETRGDVRNVLAHDGARA